MQSAESTSMTGPKTTSHQVSSLCAEVGSSMLDCSWNTGRQIDEKIVQAMQACVAHARALLDSPAGRPSGT